MRPLAILLLLVASAAAEPYASVQLRDDADHPVRVGGGFRWGPLELAALVDPQGLLDGQHTADLVIGTRSSGIELHVAWRNTAIQIAGGARFYESVVVGTSLPVLRGRCLSLHAGVEVAILFAAHGEAMPAQWLAADNLRRSVTADLFVQVRYGR